MQFSGCLGLQDKAEGLSQEWEVTINGHGISFGGNKNVVKLDYGDGCIPLNILKITKLNNLNEWIL